MSRAGNYFKTGMAIVGQLAGDKPHSSITDWVEVLSSDRYQVLSLDGIPELVESINIQGPQGTTEASRAIRKKLKYGNSHRQIRALVILRALTENCGHGFKMNWANEQLMERLKIMATDSLLDPKVKKQLILVFHAWSIQYADEPRMREVAGLYGQYSGSGQSTVAASKRDSLSTAPKSSTPFDDPDDIYSHSWAPASKGADSYSDRSTARAEANARKAEREQQMLLERKEAEIERRERELRRRQEMADIEARRRREAEYEAEQRRKAKEERKRGKVSKNVRPRFNFEKEKPAIMQAVATAIQSANNLVNACRLVNRELENVTESPNVQDKLDKAKAARRTVVRYIQQVTDEEYVGTLIDANEKIVEAILLYDKLSKPAALDSDSERETTMKPHQDAYDPNEGEPEQVERIRRRLEAQKLEANRTGELQNLQEQQKLESQKMQARALRRNETGSGSGSTPAVATTSNPMQDLQDLDFGATNARLPPPLRPDSDEDAYYSGGSLSDFSDYDSSDEEYRRTHSRQPSRGHSRSNSAFDPYASSSSRHPDPSSYAALEEEGGKQGLLSAEDPFGDPFADDNAARTPVHERQRMEWTEI